MFDGGLSNLREVGFPMRKYYGSKNEKVVMDEVRPTPAGLISDLEQARVSKSEPSAYRRRLCAPGKAAGEVGRLTLQLGDFQ